jgi:O-antigen/teichoic acid export membrane protein
MWLLQGLERMKHLALMTAISRFLPLPVLLLLVTRPDQAVLAALIVNSPAAIGAVFGLAYVRKHRLAVWHRVDLAAIRYQLSEGWAAFIGGMATSFYTTMNVLLLNGFSTPQQVSYFNASDKTVRRHRDLFSRSLPPCFRSFRCWRNNPTLSACES